MSFLGNITRGLRSLFRKEQVERELDEEIHAYQEMAAEQKMKDGLSRKEALRAVRLERGSVDSRKEVVRSGGWEFFLETCYKIRHFEVHGRQRCKNTNYASGTYKAGLVSESGDSCVYPCL